jgi:tetratricopeptide (TPR) repeat protein
MIMDDPSKLLSNLGRMMGGKSAQEVHVKNNQTAQSTDTLPVDSEHRPKNKNDRNRVKQVTGLPGQFIEAIENLMGSRRFDDALVYCMRVSVQYPSSPYIWKVIGSLFATKKKINESISAFLRAYEINPKDPELNNNLGIVYKLAGNPAKAVDYLSKAILLRDGYSEAYFNLGILHADLGRLEIAKENLEQAIKSDPMSAIGFYTLALVLRDLEQYQESIASLDRAINLNPKYASAYWKKSHLLLLLGDYPNGFELYEWRRTQKEGQKFGRYLSPQWERGRSARGRTVLVHAEQGLGDTIQFARFLTSLATHGAEVIVHSPRPLMRLLSRISGVKQVIDQESPPPLTDLQCPIMSLPFLLNETFESMPGAAGYLDPEPVEVLNWRRRFSNIKHIKVGIVWNGGFRPEEPDTWTTNDQRNIPLNLFVDKIDCEGVYFVSLQKGEPAESEIKEKAGKMWRKGGFTHLGEELRDFSDTAAVLKNLDLLISVDTSVAHLAGALGVPVWLLNRKNTCWRWQLNRIDCPWYQSVKIYRQSRIGQWNDVLDSVSHDLRLITNSSK